MSEAERIDELEKIREENLANRSSYTDAERKKIQKEAGDVIRRYEAEEKERRRAEMERMFDEFSIYA